MTSREIINADTGQREVWDWTAGTYTRTVGGTVAETRALTADEIAARPPDPTPDPAVAAAEILAEADELEPALPADLADILARAAAALRGDA